MKTVKMSLATIQGKLSRAEMKNIMAGSGPAACLGAAVCNSNITCTPEGGGQGHCVSVGSDCTCQSYMG